MQTDYGRRRRVVFIRGSDAAARALVNAIIFYLSVASVALFDPWPLACRTMTVAAGHTMQHAVE